MTFSIALPIRPWSRGQNAEVTEAEEAAIEDEAVVVTMVREAEEGDTAAVEAMITTGKKEDGIVEVAEAATMTTEMDGPEEVVAEVEAMTTRVATRSNTQIH